ncbi:hypothetical protein NKJ44_30650, partial [Mesorhizobium sp. M0130]
MRIIGMDIHRVAAEVVSLLDGEIVKLGRVQMLRNKLEEFARKERSRPVNTAEVLASAGITSVGLIAMDCDEFLQLLDA